MRSATRSRYETKVGGSSRDEPPEEDVCVPDPLSDGEVVMPLRRLDAELFVCDRTTETLAEGPDDAGDSIKKRAAGTLAPSRRRTGLFSSARYAFVLLVDDE
jgi:hypothetical protein